MINMSNVQTPLGLAEIREVLRVLAGQVQVPEVQTEVAKVAKIVSRLEANSDTSANADLTLIIAALQADAPNLILARELRYAVKMRTGTFRNPLTASFMRVSGGSPTAICLIGLVAATFFWGAITLVMLAVFEVDYLRGLMFFPLNELTSIMLAGFLGAVVSAMLSPRGTDALEDIPPGIVLVSSFLKPAIAVIVALFAYAALKSGLISSSVVPSGKDAISLNGFHWVLGFCCGFSERFALRLVDGVARKFGATRGD